MNPIQKIRTSFTWQLTLLVASFVLVISGIVIFLLARFSQDTIRDESIWRIPLCVSTTHYDRQR